MSYNYLFKLIIIGDSGVGKSCLLLSFIDKRFRQKHEVTIGVEFGARQIELDDLKIKLQIWDTAGQESFKAITRSYYRCAAGAILVYDVQNRQSFNNITQWLDEAQSNGNPQLCYIIVGNKYDMETERQVQYAEGQAFAKQKNIDFMETSAKNGIYVEEVFMKVSLQILEKINTKVIDPSQESSGVKLGKEQPNNKVNSQKIGKIKVNNNTCC